MTATGANTHRTQHLELHSPNNYIVGGGFFATSSLLPVSIAWETFRDMNGVASLMRMRERIELP